jgi:hypothetical protein
MKIERKEGRRGIGINELMMDNIKLKQRFILKAQGTHGNKYDYSKVKYVNSCTKVTIICSIHGDFEQVPSSHVYGIGCKLCGMIKKALSRTSSTTKFIEKANRVHNHKYDYSKTIYIHNEQTVIIICSIHGEFQQSPHNHLHGNGCKLCGIIRTTSKRKSSTKEFIEKANRIHNHKYDYSKVNYINAFSNIIIICPLHGEFQQQPNSHLNGNNCNQCASIIKADHIRYTSSDFIKKACMIHNHKYDYSKTIYSACKDKVIIICPTHGPFSQVAYYHLSGNGCPQCGRNRISKQAIEWLQMIRSTHPNVQTGEQIEGEYRIPNTGYFADGYCPDTNTIFEFHGDYWHGNPNRYNASVFNERTKCTMGKLYEKTKQKRITCEKLGYRYVEIWESTWIAFKKVLVKIQRKYKTKIIEKR